MTDPPSATSAILDRSVASYEALRDRVLNGSSCVGLVVLVRQGVTAWLALPLAPRKPIPSSTVSAAAATAGTVSDDFHSSLVHVLANIAVARRGEMSA